MPTENRSSTEMVSAKVCGYTPGQGQVELRLDPGRPLPAWLELGEVVVVKLAKQHQGEPVALPARISMERLPTEQTSRYHIGERHGWNACLDEIAKLGPLYTHAHVCEKCRGVHCSKTVCVLEIAGERDSLRAQLTKQDELLDRLRNHLIEKDVLGNFGPELFQILNIEAPERASRMNS